MNGYARNPSRRDVPIAFLVLVVSLLAIAVLVHRQLAAASPDGAEGSPPTSALDERYLSALLTSERAIFIRGVRTALHEDLCQGQTPCNVIYDSAGATSLLVERCQKIGYKSFPAYPGYSKAVHGTLAKAVSAGCATLVNATRALGPYSNSPKWVEALKKAKARFSKV